MCGTKTTTESSLVKMALSTTGRKERRLGWVERENTLKHNNQTSWLYRRWIFIESISLRLESVYTLTRRFIGTVTLTRAEVCSRTNRPATSTSPQPQPVRPSQQTHFNLSVSSLLLFKCHFLLQNKIQPCNKTKVTLNPQSDISHCQATQEWKMTFLFNKVVLVK